MDLDLLDRPIDTERFVLEPLAEEHLDGLFAVHGDADATRFIPSSTWQTRADAEDWLARNMLMRDEGKARRWAIVEKEDARPIGDCMLFSFDERSARAEIGFVLGRRDWGRGAMREAAGALITTTFDGLELGRIEAFADPRNVASDRVLRRLGFVHEGLLRQRSTIKGQVCDSNVYGLLRNEWPG